MSQQTEQTNPIASEITHNIPEAATQAEYSTAGRIALAGAAAAELGIASVLIDTIANIPVEEQGTPRGLVGAALMGYATYRTVKNARRNAYVATMGEKPTKG